MLAAPGDTWGISGSAFLWFFVVAGLSAVIITDAWRFVLTIGPWRRGTPQPTPTQIAYINGGRRLAVYSAIAALRAAGAIEGEKGAVRMVGPSPSGAPELDRLVYAAAGKGVSQSGMVIHPPVMGALDRLHADVVRLGWLLSPARRRAIRLGTLPVLAVLLLGAARATAGSMSGKPIGYLVLIMVPLLILFCVFLVVPERSRGARYMLHRTRRSSAHLAPSQRPAWSTYGPTGAALSVGLFGTAALWAADPAFAEAAEIQRQVAMTGTSVFTDSSPSSSSSCSSSSCSSGCGGGGGCGG